MARARKREFDPYVCEYVLKPAFWVLGLFLVLTWVVFIGARLLDIDAPPSEQASSAQDVGQIKQSAKMTSTPREEGGDSGTIASHPVDADALHLALPNKTSSPLSREPTLTRWLTPVAASTSGRAVAMSMYFFFLGASLLETYWLFVTCGRATVKIARFWFVMDSWPLWLYVSPWLFLFQNLVAFCFSAALVFPSVTCILELACYYSPTPLASPTQLTTQTPSAPTTPHTPSLINPDDPITLHTRADTHDGTHVHVPSNPTINPSGTPQEAPAPKPRDSNALARQQADMEFDFCMYIAEAAAVEWKMRARCEALGVVWTG